MRRYLIVGSGLSYHNLKQFGPKASNPSRLFDDWLHAALMNASPEERARELAHWEQAPAARVCHPQEDHLIPLMVALGAAFDEKAERVYYENDFFGGITVSSYRFGS